MYRIKIASFRFLRFLVLLAGVFTVFSVSKEIKKEKRPGSHWTGETAANYVYYHKPKNTPV